MSELTEKIVAVTMGFEGSDYDQRSALGMARAWADKGVKPEWNPNQVENKRRDDLAKELVSVLEGAEAGKDEAFEALAAARLEVNRPFLQHNPMGKAGAKPSEKKKGEQK